MNGARDFVARVRGAGSHYFDAETMRFFRSKLHGETVRWLDRDRALFVTSERFDDLAPRLYSVRLAAFTRDDDGGERVTVGDAPGHRFQEFDSLTAAAVALGELLVAMEER